MNQIKVHCELSQIELNLWKPFWNEKCNLESYLLSVYINIHTSNPALYCTEHLHAVQSVKWLCCNHFNSVINSCFLFFSRSLGKTAASQICRLWSSTKTTRPKLTERGQTHRWVNPQLTHTSRDWLNDLNDVCCVRYQIWSRGWLTALRRWRVCNSNLKTVNRMQKSWSVKVSQNIPITGSVLVCLSQAVFAEMSPPSVRYQSYLLGR